MNKRTSDEGFTLIELMVAGLIMSLVMIAAGGMMIGMLSAQRTVAVVTQTATTAQVAASGIATGVRNASDIRLTAPAAGDQLLVTRSALQQSTITWICRAWHYSAADDTLRTKTSSPGTVVTNPTASQLATWSTIATGVTPRTGTDIFSLVSGGVKISFNAATNGQPVVIDTTAIKRTSVAEAGTC